MALSGRINILKNNTTDSGYTEILNITNKRGIIKALNIHLERNPSLKITIDGNSMEFNSQELIALSGIDDNASYRVNAINQIASGYNDPNNPRKKQTAALLDLNYNSLMGRLSKRLYEYRSSYNESSNSYLSLILNIPFKNNFKLEIKAGKARTNVHYLLDV